MKDNQFTPKLFTLLRTGISRDQLFRDLIAGTIVGIVALPLAIAFAIASGVSPEKGLITAIIAGFIISAFGGSRVQIGGPTGAFIIIVYAIVQEHGVGGLTIATFMAGFLIIGLGLARMGNLLKYIPYPLIVGFTSAIAIIIFSSQMKAFFGLPIDNIPAGFIEQWVVYLKSLHLFNWIAVVIGAATALITFHFHRVTKKVPGSLIAILLSTVIVQLFDLPVETIGSRYGNIPHALPLPVIPSVDLQTIRELVQPAVAIALLGSIESLLSAVVADGMTGGRHRPNAELIAQGAANIGSAIFGGIPATGAIARTATNVKNGGRTPVSGITHAVVLLLIMLIFSSYTRHIPMSCLAGILVIVAYHMSEWQQFRSLLKGNRMDVLVMLVTFFLTLLFDLVIAIEVGIVLSSLLLMRRLSESVNITRGLDPTLDEGEGKEQLFEEELANLPQGVILYEINGALFFGATQQFQDTMLTMHELPKVLILRMRHVPFVDATGIHRLKEIIHSFKKKHVHVVLSGVKKEVGDDLEKAGIHQILDANDIKENISDSIQRARELLDPS